MPDRTDTGGLLLVHAHPDDESINTGATMAWYAARGVPVTLVTCTRGERGEVIPPGLAHLFGDGPALGAYREGELTTALAALGARGLFLGSWIDSGMAYTADGHVVADPSTPDDGFAVAPLAVEAAALSTVLDDVRPDVVVTYEPGGGYGHPDHVRAHDVTMAAVERAAHPPRKVYEIVFPASTWTGEARVTPSMVVPDGEVSTVLAGDAAARAAKVAALRAHATQVVVGPDEDWYALSNHVRAPLSGTEWFRLVRGTLGAKGPDGYETDLFA